MSWSSSTSRCIDSGNRKLHARLIGGNWVDQLDLAPSVVCCVVFLLATAGPVFRYRRTRVKIYIVFAIAFLFTGLAFGIRGGIANTAQYNVPRTAILVEQALFSLGQLLLLGGNLVFTKVFVTRATLLRWPSWLSYLGIAILVISFILDSVAFSRAPRPPTSYFPSEQYTQMRTASAALTFVVATFNALFLPFTKVIAPELPLIELALLDLAAWFLWVPAFYVFCSTTITVDSSPLVCSVTFFYLAFGLFQLLAIIPLLVLQPLRFGFTLAPHDLISAYPAVAYTDPILDSAREDARMAEIDAEMARKDEEIQRRLLEEEAGWDM